MTPLHRAAILTLLGLFAVSGEGCGPSAQSKSQIVAPSGGVLLRGAGATFPEPLYKRWFTEYGLLHTDVVVVYDAVGSGLGVKRFIGKDADLTEADAVEFAGSDAAMTDAEIAQVDRGALLVPATAGAVVLAYNIPGFKGDLKLSREAYSGIFLGTITQWNDPKIAATNPDANLPEITIAVVARQDASGTTYALTNNLSAVNPQWRDRFGATTLVDCPGDTMRTSGNDGVAGRIKQSVGSIGYVHYGFAQRLGLKMALLENKAGHFIAPTSESAMATIASAQLPKNLRLFFPDPDGEQSYPIVTFSWILLYKEYADPHKAAAVKELLKWCLTDGQQSSAELGYIRLAPNVVTAAVKAVDSVKP